MSLHIALQNLIDYMTQSPLFQQLHRHEEQLLSNPHVQDAMVNYQRIVEDINLAQSKGEDTKLMKQLAVELKIIRDSLPEVRDYLTSYQSMRLVLDELNSLLFGEFLALHQGQVCVTRKP